jgi:hypothetical protein
VITLVSSPLEGGSLIGLLVWLLVMAVVIWLVFNPRDAPLRTHPPVMRREWR